MRRAAGARRGWRPGAAGPDDPGTAAYFLAANRNKRSIRLDLRREAGRDVLRRLLVCADILVENFRVDGFARLGFDDAALETLNPRLVHLAISGYGTTGPAATAPGYDFIVQAVSGLMSITGAPDAEGGLPTKTGVAVSDITTGMLGAVAVLGALAGRDRPGIPGPRAGTADRHLAARVHARVAREPGPELLRLRRIADPARECPPEHRPVRNVRHG